MNIRTIDLEFLGLEHAIAVFVVEGPGGLALVECGPYSTQTHLDEALQQQGIPVAEIKDVFLSHIHFDHAGAAWAWAERGAKIHVHPKGLPHLAAPERLYNSARQIYGEDMDRLWGEMRPIAADRLNAPEDGARIMAAGLPFTAHYTPGHAGHHIAWQVGDGPESIVFTGDVGGVKIGNGLVQPPCPPPDIDVEAWLDSIESLRKLPAADLYLTHFGKISDKLTHLNELEGRLLKWAEWMKPYSAMPVPPDELVSMFQAFVAGELSAAGVANDELRRYEAANPAFMSVAGLMRYWKKKQAV